MHKSLAKTLFMGKTVFFMPSCHSTNEVAINYNQEGKLFDGDIVYSPNQTAGKGQRGNTWDSQPHKNLTFSIFLKPTFLSPNQQFDLNIAVSLGLIDCLNSFKLGFEVKWPNDIYFKSKKVCGILIQNNLSKYGISSSVVGIGLNVNQQEFKYPHASSLRNILEQDIPLDELLEQLVVSVEQQYLKLKSSKQEELRTNYLQNLYGFSEDRLFKKSGKTFYGRITGVTPEGKLILDTRSGTEYFSFKEVEFIH